MRKYINIVFLVASVCFSIQMQGNTVFVHHLKAELNHTSFNIEVENPESGYHTAYSTNDAQVRFPDIDFGKTYRLRVQAICNGNRQNPAPFTEWKSLTIPEKPKVADYCPECDCGGEIQPVPITSNTLRNELKTGDLLTDPYDGGSRYTIKSVIPQGDGAYKGRFLFWAEVWNVKILCDYWNLTVNTDNQILSMNSKSVYNPQFLLDVDAAREYVDGLADAVSELTKNTEIKDTVVIVNPIDEIYTNEDGDVVVVTEDENGNKQEQIIEDTDRTLITDPDGNRYVADKDGNVMGEKEYQETGGNSRLIDNYNKEKEAKAEPSIHFSKSEKQIFGFDAYDDSKVSFLSEYPELKPGYRPPFKSLQSFQADQVETDAGSGIAFRTAMGIPVTTTEKSLTLRGTSNGDEQALYAYTLKDSVETVVGKLELLSFNEQIKTVYLVSVNGAVLPDASELEQELNRIYAPAVTKWSVKIAEKPVNVSYANEHFTHGGSGILAVYNADQKKIIKAFGQEEKDALYLFFVRDVQGKEGVNGYMPQQYQNGFIYDTREAGTVAHELAHGAFNLAHTLGADANLMSYSGGTELWKQQWKLVQNPKSLFLKLLQDEEDGEIVLNKGEYVGFSPDGHVITKKINFRAKVTNPASRYIWAIIEDDGTRYDWVDGDYINSGKHLSDWTSNEKVTGKVAVWRHGDSDCFRLYKYVQIKDYSAEKLVSYQDSIDSSDGNWAIDFNVIGFTEEQNNECIELAEYAIEKLKGSICDKNFIINNSGSIALYVNSYPKCVAELSLDDKKLMLYALIEDEKANVGGDYDIDNAICRILLLTSTIEEKVELYDYLKTEKNGGRTLLETIVDDMADDALVAFSKWLTQCIYDKQLSRLEILNKDANLPSFIHRKLGANNDWFEWKLERTDGKIKITGSHKTKERYNSLTTKVLDPITLDADAMLVLHFDSPLTYGLETVQKSGSAIVIPALSFWSILEEKYERDLRLGLKVGAMIITLPAAAEGGWAGAFVLIDELALGSTILIDDTGWREAIKSDEGKLLLQAYDVLITAYFTGRALEAVGAFNGLKASYSNWQKVTVEAKEAEAITARMSRIAKIEDDADALVVRLIETGDAGAFAKLFPFKVGDEIAGIKIERIKLGSNKKIFVIGTDMKNRIEPFAKVLEKQGYKVELFNETYQKMPFIIEGKSYTWKEIEKDWQVMLEREYPNQVWIPYNAPNALKNTQGTLMYKANQQFIQKASNEGTIIDIGKTYDSHFYDMEGLNVFDK